MHKRMPRARAARRLRGVGVYCVRKRRYDACIVDLRTGETFFARADEALVRAVCRDLNAAVAAAALWRDEECTTRSAG